MKINNKGSASVFLIFLFVILLGAIGILLECARYEGVKEYSQEITESAVHSVAAEYYKPLYQDYHLFFMAFEDSQSEKGYLEDKINEYMNYSVTPSVDRELWEKKLFRSSFLTPKLNSVEVSNLITATDEEGMVFQNQATAYMKYASVEKGLELLSKNMEKVKSLKTSTDVLKEKMQCEEEIQNSTDNLVKLMELIDGISIGSRGKGNLCGNEKFVKNFTVGEPTMNSVGIKSQRVWMIKKNSFINVNSLLKRLSQKAEEVKSLQSSLEELQQNIPKKESKKEKAARKKAMDEIADTISSDMDSIQESCTLFSNTLSSVKEKTAEAIRMINEIKEGRKNVSAGLFQYKKSLQNKKADMEQDLYEGLTNDLANMENVTGEKNLGVNLEEMQATLEKNFSILNRAIDLKDVSAVAISLQSLKSSAEFNESLFRSYDIHSMIFPYQDKAGTEETENPITALHNLLSGKIADLVLPEGKEISKKSICKEDILRPHEESDFDLQKIMANLMEPQNMGGLFDLFSESGSEDSKSKLGKMSDGILMLLYEEEHFSNFMEENQDVKNRCLLYEMEYLLKGKTSDSENLNAVICSLAAWRTVMNFISIMSDSSKKEMARNTAVLLAGITGLEPLIYVTQTLILLAWSFDESLVEVAALLQDKQIAILKKGSEFFITYPDLVSLSRAKIQEKAGMIVSKKGIDYQDYLKIFLFMEERSKREFRCLDLIQKNMRIRHDKGFSIENCISGFNVSTSLSTKSKFLFLQKGKPWVEKETGWSFQNTYQQNY